MKPILGRDMGFCVPVESAELTVTNMCAEDP